MARDIAYIAWLVFVFIMLFWMIIIKLKEHIELRNKNELKVIDCKINCLKSEKIELEQEIKHIDVEIDTLHVLEQQKKYLDKKKRIEDSIILANKNELNNSEILQCINRIRPINDFPSIIDDSILLANRKEALDKRTEELIKRENELEKSKIKLAKLKIDLKYLQDGENNRIKTITLYKHSNCGPSYSIPDDIIHLLTDIMNGDLFDSFKVFKDNRKNKKYYKDYKNYKDYKSSLSIHKKDTTIQDREKRLREKEELWGSKIDECICKQKELKNREKLLNRKEQEILQKDEKSSKTYIQDNFGIKRDLTELLTGVLSYLCYSNDCGDCGLDKLCKTDDYIHDIGDYIRKECKKNPKVIKEIEKQIKLSIKYIEKCAKGLIRTYLH